jgi:hypothetical protein
MVEVDSYDACLVNIFEHTNGTYRARKDGDGRDGAGLFLFEQSVQNKFTEVTCSGKSEVLEFRHGKCGGVGDRSMEVAT